MPYIINNETREISEVTKRPVGRWMNVNIPCKRLDNWHYDLEWSYVPAHGIMNVDTRDIIVQTEDMAHDIEYYYRGSDDIVYTPGTPNSVTFN